MEHTNIWQTQDATISWFVSRIWSKIFDLKAWLRELENRLYWPSLEKSCGTPRPSPEGVKSYLSFIEEDINEMSQILSSIHKSL